MRNWNLQSLVAISVKFDSYSIAHVSISIRFKVQVGGTSMYKIERKLGNGAFGQLKVDLMRFNEILRLDLVLRCICFNAWHILLENEPTRNKEYKQPCIKDVYGGMRRDNFPGKRNGNMSKV
uniref:Uncharacterized protein n=1 Tax=Cucumis melo TaxID=3656 RepID=A0A9I9E6T7_CUCME